MADYGWTGEDAPASGNMVNHLRQTLAMKDLNDKKARELALKEEFLQRKIDQRKALMDRNVGQFQQSWKGAAPGSMPPEMIRAQMVLAKMNGSPGRVVAGQAAQADPYADTPEDTARKAAMNAKPMIGNTAAFGRIPGPLSMTTAEQSQEARNRAMKPGFHRATHAEIVAARQEARMQAMARMQQMAMAPQIALAQAQHGMTPLQMAQAQQHLATAEAIRSQIAGQNGQGMPSMPPPGAVPEPGDQPPLGSDVISNQKGVTRHRPPPKWNIPYWYNQWANQGGFFGPNGFYGPQAPAQPSPQIPATGF